MTQKWQDLPGLPAGIAAGDLDAVGTSIERIYKQSDTTHSWPDLAEAVSSTFDDLDDQQAQIEEITTLAGALDAQLAEYGYMVGLARNGLGLEQYRAAIKIEVQTLTSSGTNPQINDAVRSLLGDDRPFAMIEHYPAGFVLVIPDMTAEDVALFVLIMHDMPAAGVKAILEPVDTASMGGWDYAGVHEFGC